MSETRKGINTDERRARLLVIQEFSATSPDRFDLKWNKFLAEKVRYGNPRTIADEFIRRWSEL